jgi:hypothetical protein
LAAFKIEAFDVEDWEVLFGQLRGRGDLELAVGLGGRRAFEGGEVFGEGGEEGLGERGNQANHCSKYK